MGRDLPHDRSLVPDPSEDVDRVPSKLSPSRASDFMQCPRKFFYTSICKLRSPATEATTKGTLAHAALERIFDLPRGERTPEAAIAFVAPAWAEIRAHPDYEGLVAQGPEFEAELVAAAETLTANLWRMENPNVFDPLGRELRVAAEAMGVPLHGIIDRLDRVVYPSGRASFILSDYKTGKPAAPDDRFLDEKFFGMRVYAVLLDAMLQIRVDQLRLIYVAAAHPSGIVTLSVDDTVLARTRKQLQAVWRGIERSARTGQWETKTGPLCNWCDFQDICPAFATELADVPISA